MGACFEEPPMASDVVAPAFLVSTMIGRTFVTSESGAGFRSG
jgi:hypothetical protein